MGFCIEITREIKVFGFGDWDVLLDIIGIILKIYAIQVLNE
jgi:hypothetical protein